VNEYNERKSKLIDHLTGTRVNEETQYLIESMLNKQQIPPQRRVLGEAEIVKTVPNWDIIAVERAIKHSCVIVDNKEVWHQEMREIKMSLNPFDNGTLRYVYYMKDITDKEKAQLTAHTLVNPPPATHVAKIAIDPMEEPESYFQDVAMQKYAQKFADMYNSYDVPKKVGFLDCWVYELVDRIPHVYCGVEKYIEGDYNKYTNNWDWVNPVDRNTPQAFSHYTYEASEHKILICDVQGVCDLYTDPQMHTHDGKGCGKGNMGQRGIDKFLSAHRCNAICQYLKLPITNAMSAVSGTLPSKRYMVNNNIDTVNISTQYTIPDTSQATHLLKDTHYNDMGPNEENASSLLPRRVEDDSSTCCFCHIL